MLVLHREICRKVILRIESRLADDVIHMFQQGKGRQAKLVRTSFSSTSSKLVSEPHDREAAVVSHRSLP